MKLSVHKIIWIKVTNHGHWYDDDYTYDIIIHYDLFSDFDIKLSHHLIEDIENILLKDSSIEKRKYNKFYNGTYMGNNPKLYYNISGSHDFSYKREEIDIPLSEEICIVLNNYGKIANAFSNVPYERDMGYGYGIYPPKEFAIKYLPQRSDCSHLIYRKYYHYSDI